MPVRPSSRASLGALLLGLLAGAAFAQSPTAPPAKANPTAAPGTPAATTASPAAAPAARAPAPPPTPSRASTQVVPLDRVIAIVNDEALTQYDVGEQRKVVLTQMRSANVPPPAADVLDKQVLERLITERAIQQFAKETGIRVDDTTVERTIGRVAEENKMTQDEFRKLLAKEGMPYAQYRDEIRRQIVIQRVREREVDNKVLVTDGEVDNYLATISAQAGGEQEYLLSHIYVTVPEQATPQQIDTRRQRANDALSDVKSGKDFGQVAAAYSDAPDALSGGSLGWRTPARLPTVFADVVRTMKVGDVSAILRSAGGFHIVKMIDVRSRDQPTVVDQTHVRHILIRVNEITSEADGKAKIERLRDRLLGGAKFDDLARVNSEDASSVKGGDLGWLSPGDTVPDFEAAMNKLKIDEISQAVRTPFGWHILQVLGRRKQDITEERKREQARQALRQRKSDEQFGEFVRQLRDRTYVEYRTDER